MKFYWSYTQFPELARYDKRQKKTIWLNYSQWKWSKWYDRRSWLRFGPAFIVAFFVAGIVLGAIFIPNIEWGGGIGGVIAILVLAPFAYLFGVNTRRPLFRLYLKSKDFSLVPVNDQVRALLNLFKSH